MRWKKLHFPPRNFDEAEDLAEALGYTIICREANGIKVFDKNKNAGTIKIVPDNKKDNWFSTVYIREIIMYNILKLEAQQRGDTTCYRLSKFLK